MAKIKGDSNSGWREWEGTRTKYIAGGNIKAIATLENNLVAFYKVNINLPYDPYDLGVCSTPKGSENIYISMKTCIQIFLAALVIMAKSRKQLKCPSVGDQIDEM